MSSGVTYVRRIASLLFKAALAAAVAVIAVAGEADAQSRKRKKAAAVSTLPKVQIVTIPVDMPVGSIVIVNSERRLYYVTAKGEALRYGVAVGKHDELWMGRTFVSHKQVDPRWVPVDGEDPI